jgi:feruloyl esterase
MALAFYVFCHGVPGEVMGENLSLPNLRSAGERGKSCALLVIGAMIVSHSSIALADATSINCESMAGATLDARSDPLSARFVRSANATPDYCEIKTTLRPVRESHIAVVYRLPARWNGGIVGLGGGGQAGNVALEAALPALQRGYATAQTDAGHETSEVWDAAWAMTVDGTPNWDALIDFDFRAVHLMTVSAKALVARYYPEPLKRTLFQGCSTGGRQALIEAQRFPEDYDGIVAGAPVYDERVANSMVQAARSFAEPASHLSPELIRSVHDAVIRACDASDGLRDGIVSNPDLCHWDPGELACHAGAAESASCLSAPQVTALRHFYATQRDAAGRTVVFGVPRGAELTAIPRLQEWGTNLPERVGLQYFRGVQFDDPAFDFAQWDIIRDFSTLRASTYALLQDATNPDLSDFVTHGGRLLLWHGLYDELPRADSTLEYFLNMRAVTRVLLERRQADSTLAAERTRLFLAPGVTHCAGGPGADRINALEVMERWLVGRAPQRIEASGQGDHPVNRPWCAYPALPRYRGRGDPNAAESFVCH